MGHLKLSLHSADPRHESKEGFRVGMDPGQLSSRPSTRAALQRSAPVTGLFGFRARPKLRFNPCGPTTLDIGKLTLALAGPASGQPQGGRDWASGAAAAKAG